MGFPKALARLSGRTLLEHTHDTLVAAGCQAVRVVVGKPHGERIENAHPGLVFIRNLALENGMVGSFRVALESLLADEPVGRPLERLVLVVALVDQPCVRAGTIQHLVASLSPGSSRLAVPRHRGRGGHPFVLRADAAAEIVSSTESTVRDLLRNIRPRVDLDVSDPFVVSYIDTPRELARLGGSAPPR